MGSAPSAHIGCALHGVERCMCHCFISKAISLLTRNPGVSLHNEVCGVLRQSPGTR